jgi:hypothetical protein
MVPNSQIKEEHGERVVGEVGEELVLKEIGDEDADEPRCCGARDPEESA